MLCLQQRTKKITVTCSRPNHAQTSKGQAFDYFLQRSGTLKIYGLLAGHCLKVAVNYFEGWQAAAGTT